MPEEATDQPPSRQLSDPRQLRAITHPMRIRLLEELAFAGPATATELAERVGESPANVSWHLRQLARYGFVEEAGGGKGRQRPWRVVVQSNRWQDAEGDPELTVAGHAASEFLLEHEVAELRTWRAGGHREPAAWRDASFVSQSFGWLTAEELAAVSEEIYAIAVRTLDRVGDPALRPPGSRPVRLVAWGFPTRQAQPPVPADEPSQGDQ